MDAWDCLKESFNICSEQTDMMISALSLLLLLHTENKVNFSVYHHIYYLVIVISRLFPVFMIVGDHENQKSSTSSYWDTGFLEP